MDAVASVYRLASSLSPGIDGLRSHVESRDALESRGLRLWCHPSWVFGSSYHSLSCLAFHKSYIGWACSECLRAALSALPMRRTPSVVRCGHATMYALRRPHSPGSPGGSASHSDVLQAVCQVLPHLSGQGEDAS